MKHPIQKKNVQLKTVARGNLLGHYAVVIAGLVLTLLLSILLDIPFNNMAGQGLYFGAIPRAVVGILGLLLVLLLSIVLFVGMFWIHLRLARGQKAHIADILYPFRHQPGNYIGFGLLLIGVVLAFLLPGFICLLVASRNLSAAGLARTEIMQMTGLLVLAIIGLILLVIGIVALIIIVPTWVLTPYLMLDHSEYRLMEAIHESRQTIHGKRRRLFFLVFSFAGWLAFSILSFGIALLWIIPYMSQSLACLYMDLIPEEERLGHEQENPNEFQTNSGNNNFWQNRR